MKAKRIIFTIAIALTTSLSFSRTYTPTLAEHLIIIGVNSQIFQKMDYERKQFINNDRPYTFEEDSDYVCNAILVAKDNIKNANKYPEYQNDIAVKNYIKQHQNIINNLQQGVVKEKRTCKGYIVRLPITSKGSIPLVMTNVGASEKFQKYYKTRDNLLAAINFENNESLRKQKVCELTNFSTVTEMDLLLYREIANSAEGKKVLSTINQDRQTILKPKMISDRC
jgi:hypothetical protein